MPLIKDDEQLWQNRALASPLQSDMLTQFLMYPSVPQATPANWPNNHESIGAKGWAFILPTVTKEDADKVQLLQLTLNMCLIIPSLYLDIAVPVACKEVLVLVLGFTIASTELRLTCKGLCRTSLCTLVEHCGHGYIGPNGMAESVHVRCAQHFPGKRHCDVPSGLDYLRLTPVEDLK